MIWWRSATHVAGLDPRSLKYDRPEVGERGLASSTPPSFASGWIESPGDDIANGGWRKARRSNYKEARIGKQSDGGMARPPLRLMRFLCLSFRSKATWGDLRLDRASSWEMIYGEWSKMIIRMMHDVNGYRVKIETVEASIIFATFSISFFYFQDLE